MRNQFQGVISMGFQEVLSEPDGASVVLTKGIGKFVVAKDWVIGPWLWKSCLTLEEDRVSLADPKPKK
jgi:hypothetical protein